MVYTRSTVATSSLGRIPSSTLEWRETRPSVNERLSQHNTEWLWEEEGVSIRLGRIHIEDYASDPPDWSDWRQVLGDVEALEIYWHSPPYNSANISEYNGQRLQVVNKGERGSLVAECRGLGTSQTHRFSRT